ncbi:Cna B-type domain-containing protein [Bacillus sp. FSL R9-9492]|uniref:Cna B-type domain-containing protein n=1 Tax=Bacillus sp. FSL R9-9492 TaxID=2921592 RepID=UPI0030FC7FB8
MYLKRITSIFSIIMIFMFTIGQSLLPIVANAQELNTVGLVDNFTIGKTNLQTGESTNVSVNFSEKNGVKLKPGDTLTLTLPPELEGFKGTIKLQDYGICKVNAGTVVCTFNDKVTEYKDIQGYLNFNVTATGVGTDQKKEIETNLGTNLDKQHVTITGPKGGGGTDPGEKPFFYKAGDMRGNEGEVRWFLNINNDKKELSRDIVVTDKLQEGQTLNKNSFYINVDDYLGKQRLTPQQLESKGYGKVIFNDDNSFNIVLNQSRARLAAFTVEYTSTITEAGMVQEDFKNDYTIDYQILHKDQVSESGTAKTQNMSANGGINGVQVPKGKLRIFKYIEGNKEKAIPNVSFKLYKESGEQVGGEYKTNEKGLVQTEQLPPGKYYVQEVSAPDYIDFDSKKKVEFEIKSDAGNGIELPISNNVKTTSVSGTKMWNDNNNKFGKRPESITVQLLQNGTEFKTEIVKADKEGNWNFSFKDLPKYDGQGTEFQYTVSEVKVDGYETKVDGTTITNTYKNTETTELSGKKVWEDYNNKFGKRPESITVQLLQNGTEFKTEIVKADKEGNWNFSFKDLPKYDGQGTEFQYTVSEVKVDGYETKVEGTTITNTYKNTETTELSGKKVWEDYNNQFKTRPESITVQLLQNGTTEFQTKEVKADEKGNWTFSFTDLPKYDEQGKEFKYTVSEVKVKDYETKVEGTTITNTYKNTETTELSGKKVWEDYNNKFGKRPESITVQLLQNGTEFKTEIVKADKEGNWNFSFKDLPKYDGQGTEFQYTVSEVKVDGYETKVEGTTITNTYKNTETTELSGKKVWEDYNNQFKTRPESITVQLLQNGTTEFQTKEVKADEKGNWTFSFTDLPKYDEQGKEFKYTVSEVKVKDYETKVEGTTITNTYKNTETTEVSGKKVWEDYNNKFNTRPESITVQLLQNGTEFQTKEVKTDKDGNWTFSFKDLPKYDGQGTEFKYTVSEVKVKDYETKVEGTTITNTYKNTETTEVSGKKVWEDYNNQFKTRPESITVQLLQNGTTEFQTKEVKADEKGNWTFSFTDLPKYDEQGKEFKYTVSEVKVKDYETKVEGTTITNTYKNTETTELSGKKVWEDYNNQFKTRPESITVQLLQNGTTEFQTKEVKADEKGNWTFSFTDLPKYDEQGKEFKYTVSEVKVKDYETKVEGTTITNTYKNTETTEVSGKKVWEDYNNKFNTRPESITVQLLQNGTEFKTEIVKVDKEGNWNFSFKDLPKYDGQGTEFQYTVSEVKVKDYETKVEGTTITNTYKNTDKTELSGKKVWEDYNNQFKTRPESITVQLLQNGTEFQTKEVKTDKDGNWTFSFKDLPKYDGQGTEFKYTVSEVKVKDYETKVEGTTITNTYKNTETTEVSGKKVWEDYNNKFNTRPESITVQLLQNGTEFKTEIVKADKEGNWNFSFKDLPKYDGQGNAYTYTVNEVKVDGYETKVEGTTITNTYKNTETTEVSGKKVWEDYNNKFNTRPESITVQLLQNGTEFKTEIVKADKEGNWNFSFKDLPKYDGQGNAYTYTVNEVKVDGYETKVEGTTITNTYKNTETTEVSGKKVWEDYNNKFNTRPESITVQLLQNGTEFKTEIVKVDKEGNWNFSFKDLPKYDGQGNEFKYTVSEVKVKDYETKVDGTTITNTYKNTETTEVSGKKVWEDYNNKFNTRPESITVQLLQNGTEFQTKEVKTDKDGNWSFDFKDLPKYDEQGNVYTYTVNEVKVDGYETKVEGTTITNIYKNTETTELSGKKVWEDYNNKFNTRPESITVQLLQNGTEFQTKEVKVDTADKEGNWTFSFKDLPKYDEQGNAYTYTVNEVKVDGYETKVEGTTITNIYKNTETTEISGKKVWDDNNSIDRPSTIKVDLLQNGQVIDTKEVSVATNWKYTFENLQVYDANGVAYKYEVKEQPVAGYKSEVNGYDITNTKIKDEPNVDPKDPSTDPKDPSTDPKDPSTNPKDPSTDPKDPSTNPKDPSTDPDKNSDSKAPPTTENDKPTLLPNTGGTSAEMSSILGGIVLFLLGGILLARQRIK